MVGLPDDDLGQRIVGQLDVTAPEAVPRAEFVLVTYSVHAEPNTAVPDFLRAQAQKKALPELIALARAQPGKLAASR